MKGNRAITGVFRALPPHGPTCRRLSDAACSSSRLVFLALTPPQGNQCASESSPIAAARPPRVQPHAPLRRYIKAGGLAVERHRTPLLPLLLAALFLLFPPLSPLDHEPRSPQPERPPPRTHPRRGDPHVLGELPVSTGHASTPRLGAQRRRRAGAATASLGDAVRAGSLGRPCHNDRGRVR